MTTVLSNWIETQIAAGVLAPGARAMTPEAAAAQHNAAHALQPGDEGYLTAPAQGQARSDNAMPRTFVSCMACAGAYGATAGIWVDADEAADVTIGEVHEGAELPMDPELCEEMIVSEHELPVDGELSPYEASLWGETYAAVDEHQRQAFTAWITSGAYEVGGDNLPDVGAFEDRYCGEWASFADYSYDLVHETAMLDGVSETVTRYFDYSAFTHDLEMDYTVEAAPGGGGVFVFRDS